MTITFDVCGRPVAQGSLTSFRSASTGRIITPQKQGVKQWRDDIRAEALRCDRGMTGLIELPVVVHLAFRFQRPKGHYGTGRNAGKLKASAPLYPTSARIGDIDKLTRAALDAITGALIRDDRQVVKLAEVEKRWCARDEREGVEVELCVLPERASK